MKKKIYLSFFTFILAAFLLPVSLSLSGCKNNDLINEDKFAKIYTDLIIAHDTISFNSPNMIGLEDKIFARYRVTQKQYNATIDYYNRNPKDWQKFFEMANSYAEKLKKKNDI